MKIAESIDATIFLLQTVHLSFSQISLSEDGCWIGTAKTLWSKNFSKTFEVLITSVRNCDTIMEINKFWIRHKLAHKHLVNLTFTDSNVCITQLKVYLKVFSRNNSLIKYSTLIPLALKLFVVGFPTLNISVCNFILKIHLTINKLSKQ